MKQDPCGETQEECEAHSDKEWRLSSPRETFRALTVRESQQQERETQLVHGGTAVMTQAQCWAFSSRTGGSWRDLHSLYQNPEPLGSTQVSQLRRCAGL
jgi:hypothetical protein